MSDCNKCRIVCSKCGSVGEDHSHQIMIVHGTSICIGCLVKNFIELRDYEEKQREMIKQ